MVYKKKQEQLQKEAMINIRDSEQKMNQMHTNEQVQNYNRINMIN
jgi:hypothetical protein